MTRHLEALKAIAEDDGCLQAEQRHRPAERKREGTTRHRVRIRGGRTAVAVPLRLELLEEAWFEEPEGPEDDRDDPADPIRHRLRGHSPGSPLWREARIGVDGANGDRASGVVAVVNGLVRSISSCLYGSDLGSCSSSVKLRETLRDDTSVR